MKTMQYNFFQTLFITASLVILSGCANQPPTAGDRIVEIGEQWNKGNRLIKKGRESIRDGRNDIEEGERLIEEGKRQITEGKQMITDGEKAIELSEKSLPKPDLPTEPILVK